MGKNLKKIVQSEPDVQEEESDEEVALDEDDAEEAVLDEDAIPKQKVEIDNTVRLSSPSTMSHILLLYNRTPFVEYARPFNSTLHYHGQKPWSCLSQKPSRSRSTTT